MPCKQKHPRKVLALLFKCINDAFLPSCGKCCFLFYHIRKIINCAINYDNDEKTQVFAFSMQKQRNVIKIAEKMCRGGVITEHAYELVRDMFRSGDYPDAVFTGNHRTAWAFYARQACFIAASAHS